MNYKFYDLKINSDNRGNLVAIEGMKNIPFEIKRLFYIYGNQDALPRAGHANRQNEQVLICLNGSCRIFLDDGIRKKHFIINRPEQAFYIGKNVWVKIDEFSEGCILLVLASREYDPEDQVCDYQKFKEIIR